MIPGRNVLPTDGLVPTCRPDNDNDNDNEENVLPTKQAIHIYISQYSLTYIIMLAKGARSLELMGPNE